MSKPWIKRPLDLHETGIGYEVVDADGNDLFDDQTYYPTAPRGDVADEIVKCVNMHDELVHLLKAIEFTLKHGGDLSEACEKITAMIAKVEGE